jgi:hypothetical protein
MNYSTKERHTYRLWLDNEWCHPDKDNRIGSLLENVEIAMNVRPVCTQNGISTSRIRIVNDIHTNDRT